MEQKTLNDLVKYKNHELDKALNAAFQAHLENCPICQDFLNRFDVILTTYERLLQQNAGIMIAEYVMANMPDELLRRLDHLETLMNQWMNDETNITGKKIDV